MENKETYNEKRKEKKIAMHWDFSFIYGPPVHFMCWTSTKKDEVRMYSLWDIMAAPDELLKTYWDTDKLGPSPDVPMLCSLASGFIIY